MQLEERGLVTLLTWLLNHVDLIVLVVMFVLGRAGLSGWVQQTRQQAEALQTRKDVQLASELAYALVERYRRQNGDPQDCRKMALEFMLSFFQKLGKEPPPDLKTIAEAVWDVRHETDVRTGRKTGTRTTPPPA